MANPQRFNKIRDIALKTNGGRVTIPRGDAKPPRDWSRNIVRTFFE